MRPVQLALKYMEIFYSGQNPRELASLFDEDFSFEGPLYVFESADDYVQSLLESPPDGFEYEILETYETNSSACLIYRFRKPGITTPMAQIFKIKNGRIGKILLIFDTVAIQ